MSVLNSKMQCRCLREIKENPIAEFNNDKLVEDFALLVDIATHVNKLNLCLQKQG